MSEEINGIADVMPEEGGAGEQAEVNTQNDGGAADFNAGIADDGGAAEQGAEQAKKPEEYTLTAPEGFNLPEENLTSFAKAARDAGLSKEQAEKMLAWHQSFDKDARAYNEKLMADTVRGWQEEMRQDRDFGGTHWKATQADAAKFFRVVDPDGEVRRILRDTGFQHNPEIVRAVARAGRLMSEHEFVGANSGGASEKPLEERLWG